MELNVDQTPILGMGQRLLELKELLGYSSVNAFADYLFMSPTTFQRLTHRNPTGGAFLSTQTINRLVQRIPNLNLNWFFTGVGNPFIDHDALYLKGKAEFYKEELLNIQNRLAEVHAMIAEDLKDEKFHSTFITYWEDQIKTLVKRKIEQTDLIGMGANQKLMMRQILDGATITEKKGQIRMTYGKDSAYIPKRKVERLIKKNLLVKKQLTNSIKYEINTKLKSQIERSV
jgi:hypothetical protein